jgi:SAM-dependent methyltransferase
MPPWLLIVLGLAGTMFAVKMVYVLSTALVLPATRGALYVSTQPERIAAALDAVPMTPDQLLVDLGCGDGRVLRAARRRYGVRATGYELNPMAWFRARLSTLGDRDIRVRRRNFFREDISAADAVFCYLYPDVMSDLAAKLRRELRPGTRVLSFNFPLPGLPPEQVIRPEGTVWNDPIYLYRL